MTSGKRAVNYAAALTGWSCRSSLIAVPLRYVLEDVNRYSPKPVVIEDEYRPVAHHRNSRVRTVSFGAQ